MLLMTAVEQSNVTHYGVDLPYRKEKHEIERKTGPNKAYVNVL